MLMYSANPNLSPAEVRDIVRQTQQALPLLELAENYAIYSIPQNLPQGLYDVLLSLGGESETLTQALEVLTDCRSDEILTDTSWLWYQNGTPLQAVISPFFLGRVKILPTPEGQRPAPIWSVLNSQSRANCVDCTFDFFKTHTLPAGYQVRYGQIAAQSDDRARFFVNQTLIGESTYSFGLSSVPHQFTLPSALFASGQQAVNLQIQGWNKISAANDNYAGVAAKFTLRSCRR